MKPINKTAAIAISGGHHFKSRKKIQTADRDYPIKIRAFTRSENQSGRIDLTGIKFGRFTVIGVSAETPKVWVVRCSCGIYTERRQKSILNPNNSKDCCEYCRELLEQKRLAEFREHGRNFD